MSASVRFRPTPPALRLMRKIGSLPLWKSFHGRASIAGLAGQQAIGDMALLQFCLDQRQHRGELREQQDAPTLGEQFLKHVHQAVELAGGAAAGWQGGAIDQAQVAADLAQFEQRLENDDLAAGHALAGDFVADLLVHGQAHGLVDVTLRLVELDPVDDFGLGRQFGGHLFLGPAQQEGFDATVQMLQADFAGVFLDGHAVVAVEALGIAQPARQQEVE